MSFDLFLHHFEFGEEKSTNRDAVLGILRRQCQDKSDDHGFYAVEFTDGSHVEFSAKGLEGGGEFNGCAFHLRGFSSDVIGFIFDVACAGDLIIFNAQGEDTATNPLAILTNAAQSEHLPNDVATSPVLCTSADQLGEMLCGGYGQWQSYRDQVLSPKTS